eukprot:gene13914-15363_t
MVLVTAESCVADATAQHVAKTKHHHPNVSSNNDVAIGETTDHNGNRKKAHCVGNCSSDLKGEQAVIENASDVLSDARKLYVKTPLIESLQISKRVGYNVYIKMENLQPSGSFKLRGLSYHCMKVLNEGCKHLVSSSGGNAGLAVSYIGRKLGVPVTVFVPETTAKSIIQRMRDEGAEIRIAGLAVDDAVDEARKVLKEGGIKDGALIHPFDHENIWEGHSHMVEEIKEQLVGKKPDLIVLSVGGGGLLCGILLGMHRVGWQDVPVLAMETEGAHSFASSLCNGGPVTLDKISSIAVCLGVRRVTNRAYEWTKKHNVISEVISDQEAVRATAKLLDDHMVLVEPSCGAAMAAVYGDTIEKLQREGKLGTLKNVVIIACGGCTISLKQINEMKAKFDI